MHLMRHLVIGANIADLPASKAEEILSARVRPGPCPPMEPLSKCSLDAHQKPLSRSLTCCSPKAVSKSSTFFHTQSILATVSNLSPSHSKHDLDFFHSHRLEPPKNNLPAHSHVHLSLPLATIDHSSKHYWPQNLCEERSLPFLEQSLLTKLTIPTLVLDIRACKIIVPG